MICKHCQTNNEADAKFCKECAKPLAYGQPDDMTIEEQNFSTEGWKDEPAKKKGGKKWIVAAIAAVLVAAVGVGAFLLTRKPAGSESEEENDYGAVTLYYDDRMSFDGKTEVYEQDGDLYLRVEEEETLIAEGVSLIEDRILRHMAASGSALIYEKDEALYHYDCRTGTNTKVADGTGRAVISTNGKYVAYDVENSLYLYDGESKKLADLTDAHSIISVSDNGLIYGFEEGLTEEDEEYFTRIFSIKADGTKTVVKNGGFTALPDGPAVRNRTQDQILFAAEDEEGAGIYVSIDGNPAEKLLPATNTVMQPDYLMEFLEFVYGHRNGVRIYDISDLRGQIFVGPARTEEGDSAIFRIDEDWNAEPILSYSAYNIDMFYERSLDNSYIYANYKTAEKNNALYRIDVKTGEKEKLKEDVVWFASAGRGVVYYSDVDMTLYRLSDGKSEKIAENIGRAAYHGTIDGGVEYQDETGAYWTASRNGKPQKAEKPAAE